MKEKKPPRRAYKGKTCAVMGYLTTEANKKLRAAMRRAGVTKSDVLTYCILVGADSMTRETLDQTSTSGQEPELVGAARPGF